MSTETPTPERRSKRRIAARGGIGAVVIAVVVAYLLSIVSFAISGGNAQIAGSQPVKDGVNFAFMLTNVDPAKTQLTLRTVIVPSGSYLNETEGTFAKSLVVTARSQTGTSVTREIKAGTPVGGAVDYNLFVEGNPISYPFDLYEYGQPAADTLDPNEADISEPTPLVAVQELAADGKTIDRSIKVPLGLYQPEGLQGWTETWQFQQQPNEISLLLTIKRGGGGIAFVLVVMALMVTGATLAGLVAWAVAKKRRIIEATMAGWFAALLFAVVPLRINLPGAPPIGVWMDVLVFYWVVMALMVAMAVFIGSWLKYRKAPEE